MNLIYASCVENHQKQIVLVPTGPTHVEMQFVFVSFVIYIIIYNTTPPPLLKKQEYQQIPYLHFYSSCPPTDYAIKSWVRTQYLSMHHTFELKLRRWLISSLPSKWDDELTIDPKWGDRWLGQSCLLFSHRELGRLLVPLLLLCWH